MKWLGKGEDYIYCVKRKSQCNKTETLHTYNYTLGIGTHSLLWSHLLWGAFSAFSAAIAIIITVQLFTFHQIPIIAVEQKQHGMISLSHTSPYE